MPTLATKERKVKIMEKVFHPASGEKGFFCSLKEKELIDVAIIFLATQCKNSSRSSECGGLDG